MLEGEHVSNQEGKTLSEPLQHMEALKEVDDPSPIKEPVTKTHATTSSSEVVQVRLAAQGVPQHLCPAC